MNSKRRMKPKALAISKYYENIIRATFLYDKALSKFKIDIREGIEDIVNLAFKLCPELLVVSSDTSRVGLIVDFQFKSYWGSFDNCPFATDEIKQLK